MTGDAARAMVATARVAADTGDVDRAIRLLWSLADEDRRASLPYDVGMRFDETVGAIERHGGGDRLRAYFRERVES